MLIVPSLKCPTSPLHVTFIHLYTGFSSFWQVLSKGQALGPAGVQVVLRNAGSDVNIQATVTQPGGKWVWE